MNLKKRFGNLFILIGSILLVLFFISDYLDQVNGWYLLFGLIFFAFGVRLAWKGRTPPEPSRRFRMVKKIMGGQDKDKKEKEDQKKS
jgi:uncharacterized membrane protein YedE/YeeE